MRIGYLGPPGTFSEEALGRCDLAKAAERRDFPTIQDAIEAVGRGEVEASLVPIENSLEGSVNATLDTLVHRPGLRIRREVLLPIEQQLLALPGTELAGVTRLLSHPQPLGQCAAFLREHLPGVPQEAATSTAEAARLAAERQGVAAIGSRAAAERYGLSILRESIQDGEGNTTRFVLVARADEKPTGRDRTSIAFTLDRDRPGSLYEVLGEFARRQINLSKIESRPNKQALGHYVFFIDFEGHRSEPKGAEALSGVLERVHALHLLGSYPRG
ncbi:MAG TPA: prephenate dehydratase [Anaeromyxobacteraceae bacterium]|nr:prephenate dehydratase [Anaeromyxobacteraceae bacterium]